MIKKKEEDIKVSSIKFFDKFNDLFEKSDKKILKESMIPFFANPEEIKIYVKEPYSKVEEKSLEKWHDCIKFIKEFDSINVLRKSSNAQILD